VSTLKCTQKIIQTAMRTSSYWSTLKQNVNRSASTCRSSYTSEQSRPREQQLTTKDVVIQQVRFKQQTTKS